MPWNNSLTHRSLSKSNLLGIFIEDLAWYGSNAAHFQLQYGRDAVQHGANIVWTCVSLATRSAATLGSHKRKCCCCFFLRVAAGETKPCFILARVQLCTIQEGGEGVKTRGGRVLLGYGGSREGAGTVDVKSWMSLRRGCLSLSLSLSVSLSLSLCLSFSLSPSLSFSPSPIHLQDSQRNYFARLLQFLRLTPSKVNKFCTTSSIFDFGNIKKEAILRNLFQKWEVECKTDGLVPMRFAIFTLHGFEVLRLPRYSDAR